MSYYLSCFLFCPLSYVCVKLKVILYKSFCWLYSLATIYFHISAPRRPSISSRTSLNSTNEILNTSTESHFSTNQVQEHSNNSMLRSIVLLLALSFHSVFEGVAVGLQDSVTDVLRICTALSIHKLILAFSLGLSLTRSGRLSVATILRSCLIFCSMSPLGIAIGILVTDLTDGNERVTLLVNGTMLGIACGTFLYVVFFEIVPREFAAVSEEEPVVVAGKASGLLKVLVMILGFGAVSLVLFLNPTTVRPACEPPAV